MINRSFFKVGLYLSNIITILFIRIRGDYMPRQPRKESSTGVYHVMIRGVNKQLIFQKTNDYHYFLRIVADCKEELPFQLYAFCLMPNHVHLLMRADFGKLSHIMQSIETKYATWFNRKNERVGHLFQDRFLSEVVEDERYFLTVLRYIHQNPVKAMLMQEADGYPFSSYPGYFTNQPLIDSNMILNYITKKQFYEFHGEESDDECMDIDNVIVRLTDSQAMKITFEITKMDSLDEFLLLPSEVRMTYVKQLYDARLTKAQIHRCTGLSYRKINKVLKEE